MWKTPFDNLDYVCNDDIYTASGERTRQLYKAVLNEKGSIDLVEDGLELTYEKIQSFKDSVDINVIISRFAAGDASVLEQRSGVYGDFISVPSSYLDVLNAVVEARNAYELKQPDISFEEFINNALKPVSEAPEPIVDKEVDTNEQKSE